MEIINDLFKFNRCPLGEGIDNALIWINQLIPLDIIEIPSGTKLETWEVPDEWIVRDAWVKFKGKKIIDYKKDPLSLVIGSKPFKGKVKLDKLKKHLHYSSENPDAFPYVEDKNWGFTMPMNKIKKKIEQFCEGGTCEPELKKIDPEVGKVKIQGGDYETKYDDILPEGEYEVLIDTEYRPGTMKIGVHTIKGNDKEILLIAHLDHPFQANNNLSGVACLIDLVKKLKCDHTIKIIFCPEIIGSIAYALTQDISKVDFVIAVDSIGNDNTVLIQKSYEQFAPINYAVHLATNAQGAPYRKGMFELITGSDEYVFNDPIIGIPAILLSRFPYQEFHSSADTPEIIKKDKIKEIQDIILKTIEIMEKDFIPIRTFKGPLMRSKYDMKSLNDLVNRNLDYFIYNMDGKKSLMELVMPLEISFDFGYELMTKLEKDGLIIRK